MFELTLIGSINAADFLDIFLGTLKMFHSFTTISSEKDPSFLEP